MSARFQAVQWNRAKLGYDAILLIGVGIYIVGFLSIVHTIDPPKDLAAAIDQRIRAFGTCAFIMLTVILSIGPLARFDRRFLPLLYNRRHFGVLTFLVALTHVVFMLEWYGVRGALPNLYGELTTWSDYAKFIGFPFKVLGLVAVTILFVMAATSHDFWLAFLTPPVWKAMHMAIYPAYGLLVMHVALGTLQSEASPVLPTLLAGSVVLVAGLHLAAGRRERPLDAGADGAAWLKVGPPDSIPESGARIVAPADGERIAVFRYGGRLAALSNVCAHQNGPLGEGRIVDGCVTCPWHGFQYRPEDGCAPPPFTEKVPTFRLRLVNGVVQVDPRPLPPGTYVEPLVIGDRM
jgi:nitrite reductase/ring-hydroxylating ferredoxin subunit/DMSO/TMAO reductase YedYZ heme-binding membrane subunit